VWEQKLDAVGPRPPSVLVSAEVPELPADDSRPRTQLAAWLTDPTNPLVPRVIVNRLWQQHFGMGIVKTANDFGVRGERPSHPELLDYLAADLIESGWSLKQIHRRIVGSATYRQPSRSEDREQKTADREAADPENRLLWRQNRRRLTAEELRDAMLAVSGRLNLQSGGASVMTPVDAELVNQLYKPSQWQPPQDAAQHDRRSIYLIAKRNLRLPFLETFDGPALLASCARRESSTHAPQALEMLNGAISNDLAAAFATSLASGRSKPPDDVESPATRTHQGADAPRSPEKSAAVIREAFLHALGRPPTDRELEASVAFLQDNPLEEFTLAIFNLNGFAYVP
jgi:hypothetical protein